MDDLDTEPVEYGDLRNCSQEQITSWGHSAAESVSFALGLDKVHLYNFESDYPFGKISLYIADLNNS